MSSVSSWDPNHFSTRNHTLSLSSRELDAFPSYSFSRRHDHGDDSACQTGGYQQYVIALVTTADQLKMVLYNAHLAMLVIFSTSVQAYT